MTRHEYDSYKTQYLQDYEQLRNSYDMTKLRLFEEKKKMGQEYQVSRSEHPSISKPIDSIV